MSAVSAPRAAGAARRWRGATSPSERRLQRWGFAGAAAAAAGAFAISLASPTPNPALTFGLMFAVVVIFALIFVVRLEVGVTILALYIGLLDGPVKLLAHNQLTSATRDVLIAAVSGGAILRIVAKREKVRLPPLTGWVFAFTAIYVVEAFNPKTISLLKVLGGYRQNLEWVPFFFFGYALIRSKRRFAQMFVILGVIGLANGVVSTYQTQIGVAGVASWGPGYAGLANGNANAETGGGVAPRRYTSNGEALLRPMGLQSDSGGGAGVGVIALPATLALLAFGGRKRRIYAAILVLGSIVAIMMGLGRLQVIGGLIAAVSFALLSLSAGPRVTRPLAALLAIVAIALPLGALFVTAVGTNIFSRYESIAPTHVVETSTDYKEQAISQIPGQLSKAPFGVGLATAGPAVAFGGSSRHVLENHGVDAETQYNYAADEAGALGLIIFVAISIEILVLLFRWLPKVPDLDVRIALAGVFSVFIAHAIMGTRGAFMDTAAAGSYFWFSFGIAAYWFAGPGRPKPALPKAMRRNRRPTVAA